MRPQLNKTAENLEISGIRKFFNMVSDEQNVTSLTIGQPDFHTPEHVKNAANHALDQNKTMYTPNAGIMELRTAIGAYYQNQYGIRYEPKSEIIVTTGASQAIDIALRTILEQGDEVILPAPIYPGYEPLIKLAGATTVYADTSTDHFKLTRENLERHITAKTKCVVLPYPSNPTGVSFTKEELQELVSVLEQKNIFILADEIYSELVYDWRHTSIASFAGVGDRTIVINGVSKSHAMTGFRIGYALAPEWLARHMLKVHQYNVSCASSISQYAALEALTEGVHDPAAMRSEYQKRRDYVYNRLVEMGLEVYKPDGAFYFFPAFPVEHTSSLQLGIDLVRKGKVALVPGSSFSSKGEGYMRLSYAYDMNTIKTGLDRLESFLRRERII
ncbi:aminotransferase [Lentibacillus halodurans]|uniref:Aminotransferase n=1 Tax=Lentibacillus halodurans TaxID=237679 RepID=A0A1I1ABH9_9BACI|nr:aminotransferase A [Lentibacillus halodurans]SFB35317.1 aminotransferase [Lentibacillus halodurans]